MIEHEELVDELSAVEKMSTADRLKTARKKRLLQLKKYQQYERQLEKENSKKTSAVPSGRKKAAKPVRPQRTAPRVQFVSNVVLLEAAARNDIDEVRKLLQGGTSPDASNDDGLTALHQCCIDDSEEMARLLVEFGANVDALDSELWTPLHAAATCAHVHLCRFLVEHHANLLAVNADGNMPYDICEDEVTLDYIESEMAKRGVTQEMIDGLRLSRENLMLLDLQEVAKTGGDLECRARQGETPLHIAAANGYIQVTEFLLSRGVTVDVLDSDSWQPIHCAACWGQLPVLEMLLERGASLEAKTRNGETVLDLCDDEELKERIAEIQREIEHSRLAKSRELSRRRSTNIRSASVRRTSMREKKAMSLKEAREEAQKLLESANAPADDDEDEGRSNAMNGLPSTSAVILNVTPPVVNNSSDIAQQPAKPLRSALRSSDPKVAHNDVPLKSEKNQSTTALADKSGRKVGRHAVVDRKDTPVDLSGGSEQGGRTAVDSAGGDRTTLLDLKRERARSRPARDTSLGPQSLVVKTTTTSSVGNGDVSVGDHEPRLRLTSPEFVSIEEKQEHRCCVII